MWRATLGRLADPFLKSSWRADRRSGSCEARDSAEVCFRVLSRMPRKTEIPKVNLAALSRADVRLSFISFLACSLIIVVGKLLIYSLFLYSVFKHLAYNSALCFRTPAFYIYVFACAYMLTLCGYSCICMCMHVTHVLLLYVNR